MATGGWNHPPATTAGPRGTSLISPLGRADLGKCQSLLPGLSVRVRIIIRVGLTALCPSPRLSPSFFPVVGAHLPYHPPCHTTVNNNRHLHHRDSTLAKESPNLLGDPVTNEILQLPTSRWSIPTPPANAVCSPARAVAIQGPWVSHHLVCADPEPSWPGVG
ncbi:hypothetical protein BO99DRAFT_184823 [Aspergillus violaceofuscus CBS 115571]|uniref:Uncharacterized protein n=1 Tax=Aspergillus violaceofuscus (strain CBS 115571) TaxID=1450538 RepID=A0A2V5H1W3_ASPV1|nr:hypothetical protein BO99DRAFT_184823 [Aspergillus violaceofuscus CBS 115571]